MENERPSRQRSRSPDSQPVVPPTGVFNILRHLGPGLIIAAGIVGSGELIATTKTGADAGFWLLWLILIGCIIKVFVQIEFGRYTMTSGNTTMDGLSEVPGPRMAGRGNWLVWYWLVMFMASLAQAGGIVGGVGQAVAIGLPITDAGARYNAVVDVEIQLAIKQSELAATETLVAEGRASSEAVDKLSDTITGLDQQLRQLGEKPTNARDDTIWALIIGAITSVMLVIGRYRMIQWFATLLVVSFTIITIVNLLMLQAHEAWAVRWTEITRGLSFRLPPAGPLGDSNTLATALATFGIIGVGAGELVAYPYWCLEKGYAQFTGRRDDTNAWAERARGWMRVMRWDAWCSMVIYTFATIAFYLLGAAILNRIGLSPKGPEMIHTLSAMYEPVFGPLTQALFLFGAFAVLYSTHFVGNASAARVLPDALRVMSLIRNDELVYRWWVRFFSGLLPIVAATVYAVVRKPVSLVLVGAFMQATMLPMLAIAAIYFRYRRCDRRIIPGRTWDILLWVSACGMVVAGVWAAWSQILTAWIKIFG